MGEGFAAAMRRVRQGEVTFSGLVSAGLVQQICCDLAYKSQAKLYTPMVTLLTFINQLLSSDGSCQQAVDSIIADRVAAGRRRCSADTGGYCKARSRLPEEVFWQLFRAAGQQAEAEAPQAWFFQGHRVRVVDCSTLRIADSDRNRSQYPLQKNLEPGKHYPVVRILVVFSLSVGTVLEAALSPYQGKGTGETGMLRAMADRFQTGDILLGDRYYCGYWDLAFWLARGVHLVSVVPVSRHVDFRKGTRLGRKDHVIHWKRPRQPGWIDPLTAQYVGASTIAVRELHVSVDVPGFRVRQVVVATTLMDPQTYGKQALANLYRQRWQAELNLRSLKMHLGMEQLRCQSPEMVRKEFATYLLAYNCVRRIAAEAAVKHGRPPFQISFKQTLQTMNEFFRRQAAACDLDYWIESLLATIAEVEVAHRPNRIEPYACKTRPKEFPAPKEPRQRYKHRKIQRK